MNYSCFTNIVCYTSDENIAKFRRYLQTTLPIHHSSLAYQSF